MFTSFFTAEPGEVLEHSLPKTPLIEAHTGYADLMTSVTAVLTALLWAYRVLDRLARDSL